MSDTHSEQDVAPAQADHGEGVSHIEPDDVGVGLLTVLGALVAVVVVLIVVLLQAWFYNWKVELSARQPSAWPAEKLPATIAKTQLQQIESYGWADPKTKKARGIPISRAMELVAKELATPVSDKETGGK